MKKSFSVLSILCFLALAAFARAGEVETCDQYQAVTIGNYVVNQDYWNKDKCPGTQCMRINDKTGEFTVTKVTYDCGYSVGGYPNIMYGCNYGVCSPGCVLPKRLDALKSLTSSWAFEPSDTGKWDAAYDIWMCPDGNCGSGKSQAGAEVMIWLDYRNTNGWEFDKGPVTLCGKVWEVWYWDVKDSGGHRNYIAYLAKDRTDSVKDLDLLKFLNDAKDRGYIQPSWDLYAVFAGVEIDKDGVPFTSKSFSVSVDKDKGTKTTYGADPPVGSARPKRVSGAS